MTTAAQTGRRLETYIMILIMVTVTPLGDIFLRQGMSRIGAMASWAPADVFHFFLQAFTSPLIWLGIGLQLAFFIAYLLVLSWADYSYVQPVSSAISYPLIALLAQFILHESVTPLRWAGVAVICFGVFLVGRTQVKTTGDQV
jgi:drug/metabolite transporter (DMT)-like permease